MAGLDPLPPIDPGTLSKIFIHAEACFPRECCGYLVLEPGGRWRDVPCDNQQDRLHALDPQAYPSDATRAYHIGGRDLLGLARSFESDRPARIIYHSHPSGGAYFSKTDRQGAVRAGYPVDYLVVDVSEGVAKVAKLFDGQDPEFAAIAHYEAPPPKPS